VALAEVLAAGENPQDAVDTLEPRVIAKIKVIAVKIIAHACISTFAALFYAYGPPIGYYLWTAFVLLGMHVCFNMKIEQSCCPVRVIDALSRHDREVAVILLARRREHERQWRLQQQQQQQLLELPP
jgi:hypothetical protein